MNHKESERIAKLETQVSEMRLTVNDTRTDVKKIMTNELPHLKLLITTKITTLKDSINEEFKGVGERISKSEKKLLILWTVLLILATIIQIVFSQYVGKFLR